MTTDGDFMPQPPGGLSEKIFRRHRERLAIVTIRQSTVQHLARSNRDWHQLLEICSLFDTLIADCDGVYDAGHFNDRLLLGLKATMSEAELHILKARMLEGRRAKARRG